MSKSISVSPSAQENRARRAARTAGYAAIKSRRQHPLENHGGFMIVDPATRFPVAGFHYELSADAVVEWCSRPGPKFVKAADVARRRADQAVRDGWLSAEAARRPKC